MKSHFFALLSRMKYINRWGLMHSARKESLSEHTVDTGFIIHCLISIHNKKFGGNLSAGEGVLYSLYHDCSEILTGDLPTPVKYYNKDIINVYKDIENIANNKLLSLLPSEMVDCYSPYLNCPEESPYHIFLKAADKISALIKCIEEKRLGNREFDSAYETILKSIKDMNMEEANIFLESFIPSYELNLDQLKINQ